jgi:lipid-binding SYLF domain-containing protein
MKPMILGLILLGLAGSAMAIDKTELDNRIRTLTAKFVAMQQKADKSIPAELLRKARGIILLDRTKAGFIFAYQGGSGVAMVRDPKTDKWSPAAFLAGREASLGFQVGGEQSFFVILLMTQDATRYLTEPNYDFGGEARGTAGGQSAGAAGTVATPEKPVLVFDDRQGLYGGAAIKGGAISPDEEANRAYYEKYLTVKDLLFENKVKPTDAGSELTEKINDYSKPPPKGKSAGK